MTGPDATTVSCASCPSRPRCVLSAVEPEALRRFAPCGQRVRFERGTTIVHEGTPSTGWVILCHGRARLTVSTEDGKRLLLRFCGPGELLAGSLSGPHGLSVTAASRCVVGFVPREHVLDFGRRCPELLAAAHLRWEERERALTKRLVDLAYASTRRRLVRVLLELAEEHGVREGAKMRIELPLLLGDLAGMIGASRQTTCEEVQLLRAEGLIEVAWPRVFRADVEHLRQLS
ncbi:Crp/Fnr family transcriptional regulator [Candidatus Bipolaricaulota bacterium]|nr:Crp/Fnr family transcriptional regulator [Candidatus Bipolaricaulota bacterium]